MGGNCHNNMGERYDISRHTEKSWIVTMVELVDHPIRICSLKCDMLQSSQVKVRINSYANNDSKSCPQRKQLSHPGNIVYLQEAAAVLWFPVLFIHSNKLNLLQWPMHASIIMEAQVGHVHTR